MWHDFWCVMSNEVIQRYALNLHTAILFSQCCEQIVGHLSKPRYGINAIGKTCSVEITTKASSFKDICINKPPLPTDVFEDVNTPISYIDTTDIDDIAGPNSFERYRRVFYITLWKYIPSVLLGDENLNNTYASRHAHASCQLVPPLL